MKIIVANPGSTSYKCKLYDADRMIILFEATVEKIGGEDGIYSYRFSGSDSHTQILPVADHYQAVALTIKSLKKAYPIEEISAVGFKTVHAKGISDCVELTHEVISAMEAYRFLAPVHTDVYITAISIFEKVLPEIPRIGLFETHFHKNIPPEAYMYGIPYKYYEKHGIRKFGFHGSSHRYVGQRAKELFGANKIISCHLGGSSSVCAIQDGWSVDTSMGMSPQSGLLNAKRVGDLDPFALLYLMEEEDLTIAEMGQILNTQGGLVGISGVKSGDFRDIEEKMDQGDERAILAFNTYTYYVKRYIGEYLAILNGADCIVFTAGAGQKGVRLRKVIVSNLENLGIILDEKKNTSNPLEGLISSEDSKIKIAIIPTNEESIVAEEVKRYLTSS